MSDRPSRETRAAQLDAFAEECGLTLSDRIRRFWLDEVGQYGGKQLGGLPSYGRSTLLDVLFIEPSLELFEDNEVDRDDVPTFVPLAMLGQESQFLVVDAVAPDAPVRMWEHEDGTFYKVAKSLDELLARLVEPGYVPPIERLERASKEARALEDAGKPAEALALLEPALALFAVGEREELDGHQGSIGEAWSLAGICYKDLGRHDEAIAAYEKGIACDSDMAALNLLGLYEDLGRDDDLRRVATTLEDGTYYFQEYPWFWVRRYLAGAALRQGDLATAEKWLREVHERYWKKAPAKIDEVRAELGELAGKSATAAPLVAQVLTWFAPKSYALSPEEHAANRAWWNGLARPLRKALCKAADVELAAVAADEVLARVCDLEDLELPKSVRLDDVTPLAHLRALTDLDFHGDPETLEPLRALPALERVTLCKRVIRGLRLPLRANRALFAAAAALDAEGVAAALAAGADITGKDEHGKNVLFLAWMGRDEEDEDDDDDDDDDEDDEEAEADAEEEGEEGGDGIEEEEEEEDEEEDDEADDDEEDDDGEEADDDSDSDDSADEEPEDPAVVAAREREAAEREAAEEALRNRKLDFLVHLVELGADPYANGSDQSHIGGYLGGDHFARLEAAYRARGGQPPDSPYRVLDKARTQRAAEFDDVEGLGEVEIDGDELIGALPAGAFAQMRSNYGGAKKDVELRDYHETHPGGSALVSERFRDVVLAAGAGSGVEFLPIELRDHAGAAVPARYYLLHACAYECLDDARAEPTYNHISPESASELKRMALVDAAIPADAMFFRVKRINSDPLLVRKAMAEAIRQAGLTGVAVKLPKR